MKKFAMIVYYIRIFLLTIHFYFVFIMLNSILDTKLFGYIFLAIYFVYIIKTIIELLSQKRRYKNDLIYNLMQIGVLSYIVFFALKVSISGIYVTNMTYNYFKTNYIIISFLIIFVLIYYFVELYKKK